MKPTRSVLMALGTALILTLTGCDDDQPKIDPSGPQPPPSGPGYDSTMAEPAGAEIVELELVANPVRPSFETGDLPGLAGRDWVTTPGGSWYTTVMPGTGPAVDPNTGTVTVRLSLWTADGTPVLLDSESDGPLVLPVGSDMFAGWNETLAGMKIGEVRKMAIPHDQTVGQDGRSLLDSAGRFDDEQLLVADVTLIAIDDAEPTTIEVAAVDS